MSNEGFDPAVIQEYRELIEARGALYIEDDDDERTDEYCHFFFIGKHEGREVVYDAVMYTLRLEHESELYRLAEERASQRFPEFRGLSDESSEETEADKRDEEIGMYMAEVIMELEEEEAVRVREHVDVDSSVPFGVALDIGLHRSEITPEVVENFIRHFNAGTLTLDEQLYSFQTGSSD